MRLQNIFYINGKYWLLACPIHNIALKTLVCSRMSEIFFVSRKIDYL